MNFYIIEVLLILNISGIQQSDFVIYTHTHTHTHTQEGMATHSSILAWRILMDRGAWRTAVSGVTKSQTRLNTHAHTHTYIYMYIYTHICIWASQVALVVKNLSSNAGDVRDSGLIPGSGKSPRGDHSNPLQYSCLENPHRQRSLSIGLQRVGHD